MADLLFASQNRIIEANIELPQLERKLDIEISETLIDHLDCRTSPSPHLIRLVAAFMSWT